MQITMRRQVGLLLLGLCVACAGATTPASVEETATPGPDLTATAALEAQAAEAATAALAASQTAATATAEAAATGTAEANTQATATMVAHKTQSAEIYRTTQAAAKTEIAVEATAVAAPLAARVEQLVADGYLTRSEGTFVAMEDFKEEWAQINWYEFFHTDTEVKDFVIQADLKWASASDKANWFFSGCGFVFRASGDQQSGYDHYLVYLGLDGFVYVTKAVNGKGSLVAQSKKFQVDIPTGTASMLLAAEGSKFTVYVNGVRALTAVDGSFTSGELAYTLLSGTNKDYGTRCAMTNIQLWQLK